MTTAPAFRIVDRDVASNPVARAIARDRLRRAALDFRIELYERAHGDNFRANALAAAQVFAVALAVLQERGQAETPAARILAGGMSTLSQCSARNFKWREIDAPAVDLAITHAVAVYESANARETNAAWHRVRRLEAEAAAAVQTPTQVSP